MNVILLSDMWPRPGFPESGVFVFEQARELQRAGCYIGVVAPVPWSPRVLWFREKWRLYGQAPLSEFVSNMWITRPHYVRPPGRIPVGLEALAMGLAVVRPITKLASAFSDAAVLHAHRLLPEGLVAVRLKRLTGLPVVVTGHGTDVYGTINHHEATRLAKQVLQGADAVIGVSRYIADMLIKLGARSVEVVPNGYDARATCFSVCAPRFGQKVVYVGRLDSRKGVFDLLEAFARAQALVPSATLTYVGDGPDRARLEQLSLRRGIRNVSFTGRQPHDRIPAILQQHQVFVLPSYAEGLPTALVEAMAIGLAVVATPVGGIPELVANERTGLLASPGDVQGISRQLQRLLSDPLLQMRLRTAAREVVARRYTWETVARRLIAIYTQVSRQPHESGPSKI